MEADIETQLNSNISEESIAQQQQQQQRRGLLERKPKVELSDISPGIESTIQTCPNNDRVSDSTQPTGSESGFASVQKCILESSLFSPINITNNFFRRTSKILLENNLMEQASL